MEKNTYNTKQKQYILNILEENKDKSLSSSKLLNILENSEMPVSKATLYRFLDNMVSEGIVRKFYNEEIGGFEYQLLSKDKRCNDHLHLRCKICGNIFHLDCIDAHEFIQHIQEIHGFQIVSKDTIIYGICQNCQKKGR